MKRQKTMLLAVVLLVTVLTINAHAMPVACSVSYSDGLSTGICSCPHSVTTTQPATLKSAKCTCITGVECWKAVIDRAYAFSYACSITLPEVGKTYNGGLFDQTFHDTTKTHEDWHYNYMVALVGSTYGALETWSASYTSHCCKTEAAALALGNTDLANALNVAKNAFDKDFSTDLTFETDANSYCHKVDIGGVDTWRSVNPDWGQAAVNYANGITVTFTKGPGDCPCVPEPSTWLLLFSGSVGIISIKRKLS